LTIFKLIKDIVGVIRRGTKEEDMRHHISGSKTSKDGTRSVSMYDIMDSMYDNDNYKEFRSMDKREK